MNAAFIDPLFCKRLKIPFFCISFVKNKLKVKFLKMKNPKVFAFGFSKKINLFFHILLYGRAGANKVPVSKSFIYPSYGRPEFVL